MINRFTTVMMATALLAAGCATSSRHPLVEVKTAAQTHFRHANTAGVFSKTFTWGQINVGDCHQIEGTLVLRSDGTATFSCVTWTHSTHSGDFYHSALLLQDHSGVNLHNEPFHTGPRMNDGNPPPRYRWHYDFTFDKNNFNKITKIRQGSKC